MSKKLNRVSTTLMIPIGCKNHEDHISAKENVKKLIVRKIDPVTQFSFLEFELRRNVFPSPLKVEYEELSQLFVSFRLQYANPLCAKEVGHEC